MSQLTVNLFCIKTLTWSIYMYIYIYSTYMLYLISYSSRIHASLPLPLPLLSSSIHHSSFKPVMLLIPSSSNPLAPGKRILPTFHVGSMYLHFITLHPVSFWEFRRLLRWNVTTLLCGCEAGGKIIAPLHRDSLISYDQCTSYPALQGVLHGPVGEDKQGLALRNSCPPR